MPIHPKAPHPSTGTAKGVADKVSDLNRRIKALEADRTVIGPESIAGEDIAPSSIDTGHIQSGAIDTDSLAAGAITSDKIEAGAITANEIAAGAITANEIAANSITTEHLQAGSVDATSIAANAITAVHLRADSVTAGAILANSIGAAHIQAGSIDASLIAANAITANHIQVGAVTAEAIATNSITANNIAAGAITASEIAAGVVSAAHIAASTITSNLLASNAVTGDKIIGGAITSDKISVSDLSAVAATMGTVTGGRFQTASNGARVMMGSGLVTSQGTYAGIAGVDASENVTFLVNAADGSAEFKGTIKTGSSGLGNISGQINGNSNIVGNTITGDRLVIDAITTREVAANAITAVELAANAVTAAKILAGTITANELAAGSVTGTKIVGDAIDGKTITGATFQTAATGARVVMDATGLRYINSSSVTTVDLSASSGGLKLIGPNLYDGTAYDPTRIFDTGRAVRWTGATSGNLLAWITGAEQTNTNSRNLFITAPPAGAGGGTNIELYSGLDPSISGAINVPYCRMHMGSSSGYGGQIYVQANNGTGAGQMNILVQADGKASFGFMYTGAIESNSYIYSSNYIQAASNIISGGHITVTDYVQAGSLTCSGNLSVSTSNATGGGIVLADDGSIVDNNNGYCAMRFSSGVTIANGRNSNTVAISLEANGGIYCVNVAQSSDIRIKKNIRPISDGSVLDDLRKIRGIKFEHKESNETSYSVIAQELQQYFPDAVSETSSLGALEDKTSLLGIKTLSLTAVLLEAIKELSDKVDTLEAEIKTKKNQ